MIVGIDHLAVYATDQEKSLEYYKKLGFEVTEKSPTPSGEGHIYRLKSGDAKIDLFSNPENAGINHIAFKTADTKKTYSEIKDRGIEFKREPRLNPRSGRTIVSVPSDPDGIPYQLSN